MSLFDLIYLLPQTFLFQKILWFSGLFRSLKVNVFTMVLMRLEFRTPWFGYASLIVMAFKGHLNTGILTWAPKLNAQLKKQRNETVISFLIEFLIRVCKGSIQLCLLFLKDLFKHNTQKGCIIHHMCYRPCLLQV